MKMKLTRWLALCLLVSSLGGAGAQAGKASKPGSGSRKVTVTCPTSSVDGSALLNAIPADFNNYLSDSISGFAKFDASKITTKVVGSNLVCSYAGLTTGNVMLKSVVVAAESALPSCPTLSNNAASVSMTSAPSGGWSTSNFAARYSKSVSVEDKATSGDGYKRTCKYNQETTGGSLIKKSSLRCTVAADKKSFECSK